MRDRYRRVRIWSRARLVPLGLHQYSNMSLNVPRPFPKMGTLRHLQNGYIHLKDTKRVHCCTSGKQAELGTLLDFWEKNVNNVIF